MSDEMNHPASPSSEAAPDRPQFWTIGTLTYTFSGIVVLFMLLLAGDFIWSLRERSASMIVRVMFKQFGASDSLNGFLISSLPGMISLVLCPIISYRSDRHRGRWGRRIPYLFITTPIVACGMVGLAFSPMLAHAIGGMLNWSTADSNMLAVGLLGLFWMLFEFGAIAGNAVFVALINDVVPKEFLGRFYGLFRIMSLTAGIIFNYWLFGYAEVHYMWLFLGLGAIYALGFTAMCFKVKEGSYPPPPDSGGSAFTATRSYFRECFNNPYYLLVFAMLALAALTFLPVNTYCVLYAMQLNISLGNYGKYIAYSYAVSFVLSFFIGVLVDRFHPLRCALVTLMLYALSMLVSGIYAPVAGQNDNIWYGWAGNAVSSGELFFAITVIVHCVVSGIYFTATASLPMRLFPQARFAQFNSAASMVMSLIGIVAVPAIGSFLDWRNHDYRWIFYFGAIFSLLAFLTGVVLYGCFRKFGGPKNYIAPEF